MWIDLRALCYSRLGWCAPSTSWEMFPMILLWEWGHTLFIIEIISCLIIRSNEFQSSCSDSRSLRVQIFIFSYFLLTENSPFSFIIDITYWCNSSYEWLKLFYAILVIFIFLLQTNKILIYVLLCEPILDVYLINLVSVFESWMLRNKYKLYYYTYLY